MALDYRLDYRIVVPTIGRPDLLDNCLRSLAAGERTLVINNARSVEVEKVAKSYGAVLHTPNSNLGVAGSWNQLILGRGWLSHPHSPRLYVFCSAATVLSIPAADWLTKYFYNIDIMPGFVTPAPVGFHWWGLKKKTVSMVGLFDDAIYPAMTEDTDYRRRMRLMGMELCEVEHSDVTVQEIAHGVHELGLIGNENDDYFFGKWGCTPAESADISIGFMEPFNGNIEQEKLWRGHQTERHARLDRRINRILKRKRSQQQRGGEPTTIRP